MSGVKIPRSSLACELVVEAVMYQASAQLSLSIDRHVWQFLPQSRNISQL